jgi:hypothetical protein
VSFDLDMISTTLKAHQKNKVNSKNLKEIGPLLFSRIKISKLIFEKLWSSRLDCGGPSGTFDTQNDNYYSFNPTRLIDSSVGKLGQSFAKVK